MAKFPERSPSSSVLSGVGFLSKACFFAGEYEMTDPRRCSRCGTDVEETFTARICQGCGIQENECECEKA